MVILFLVRNWPGIIGHWYSLTQFSFFVLPSFLPNVGKIWLQSFILNFYRYLCHVITRLACERIVSIFVHSMHFVTVFIILSWLYFWLNWIVSIVIMYYEAKRKLINHQEPKGKLARVFRENSDKQSKRRDNK